VRTIAIVNQKGGCGKTTTAINLAGVFAGMGYRTLLVDVDPQSHCAAGLAIPEQRIDVQIGDAMAAVGGGRAVDLDRLLWRVSRNLDLAPSTMKLAALESTRGELAGRSQPESRLAKVLAGLGDRHDICLVDCSPAIGMLTFNALVAATEVIIPVETGFFSLQGATKQANTIKSLGKRLGVAPPFRMLATMHVPESVLARELLEELKRRFPGKVMGQVIRYDQRLREAASFGQPVIEYAPDSTGAEDYRLLAEWLVANQTPISTRRTLEDLLPRAGVMEQIAAGLPAQVGTQAGPGHDQPTGEIIVRPDHAGSIQPQSTIPLGVAM
jgi:chromosome partitioning protein